MNIFFEYIKYRWNAKELQGIHSPFVFDLMSTGLTKSMSKEDELAVLKFVSSNKDNNSEINISDYGAKSKKLKQKRVIKQVFKTSSSFGKNGRLLFKLCAHFKPKQILELGTSIGMGALYMHLGAPDSNLITIEGCKETYAFAKKNLAPYPILLLNNTFEDGIKKLKPTRFDLVFIDGHHDGKALIKYIKDLEGHTHDQTIFILDDIRWSKSMLDSWNNLIKSDAFNLSMDFFRMGVLIKRPQQVKEHFILKLRK